MQYDYVYDFMLRNLRPAYTHAFYIIAIMSAFVLHLLGSRQPSK